MQQMADTMDRQAEDKKYVVVLAHADGWGAESANKVVKAIHERYPDLGIHLIVSQATKDKEGRIATKLDDLRASRELKETNLLEYFRLIDERYDRMPGQEEVNRMFKTGIAPEGMSIEEIINLGKQAAYKQNTEMLTFKQLAKRYCADGEVHYTDRGGFKGGEQVASIIENLEKQNGKGPEVLLSVDTMAILPAPLLERYSCFSTHPGPLDTIKIEGMQGTLRALANQVLFDHDGKPIADHEHSGLGGLGLGPAYVKGTLFLQHPELDKGPPIATALTPVMMGMCAYQTRDDLYHALTDEMLALLPTLLDKDKRAALVEKATREKEALDALPHRRLGELEPEQLATWQCKAIAVPNDSMPHGMEVLQNVVVNPAYFENRMREYFPGSDEDFEATFQKVYGGALDRLASQSRERLADPWAKLYAGDPDIVIKRYKPGTTEVVEEFSNAGKQQR